MPKLTSQVWRYFAFKPDNPKVTICQVPITNPITSNNATCNKPISYKGSSTSAMARHLKSQHNIDINETETIAQSFTFKQTNEQLLLKQNINSSSEALARCVLVDQMSTNTILNSEILKDYLDKVHHSQMPQTEEEFNEIIIEYYNQVVEKFKLLFEHFKTKNAKFSITFDPVLINSFWGSNERWISLTVHCKIDSKSESFVLAYSADKVRVEQVLRRFGLDLDSDIVSCTRSSKWFAFSANAINLVCIKSVIGAIICSVINNNDICQWARALARYFSNVEGSRIHQKFVFADKGEELECICDRTDDWITTKQMMERLLLLQSYIKLTFDNENLLFNKGKSQRSKVYYDGHKFNDLKSIVECLKLLENTALEIGNPNSNLLTVDESLKNIFEDLRQIDSDFSRNLVVKMNAVYLKLRNRNLVSVMYFLKYRKFPTSGTEYSSKDKIIKTANYLNQRWFNQMNRCLNKEDLRNQIEFADASGILSPQLQRLDDVLSNIRTVVTRTNGMALREYKLNHSKIIEELVFLKYYFFNKVEIPKTEQTKAKMEMSKLSSRVCHYFEFKSDNPKVTICNLCNKKLSCSSSSTSAMARHLKSQHNVLINQIT